MTLTDEQAKKIKEQLLTQLDNFPENRRNQIEDQVKLMDTQQVEEFVEQNKLTHLEGQCIFCSIIAGKTPSFKIAENSENVAILEINPLSKGHTLIIPKDHEDTITSSTETLAEEVSKRLQEKFSPEKIQKNELKIMEHALIEIIPIYGNEKERKQASEEELEKLREEILTPIEKVKIEQEPEQEKNEKIPKLPPRIP